MFDQLLGCMNDIDTALGMFYAAGTSITPGMWRAVDVVVCNFCCVAELGQACKAVTGYDINQHLINVLFTMFDENGNQM